MSLITDALKAAQRENRERSGSTGPNPQMVEGFFPHSARSGRENRSRTVLLVGAGALTVVVIAAVVWAGKPLWTRATKAKPTGSTATAALPGPRRSTAADTLAAAAPADSVSRIDLQRPIDRPAPRNVDERPAAPSRGEMAASDARIPISPPPSQVAMSSPPPAAREPKRDTSIAPAISATKQVAAPATKPAEQPVTKPVDPSPPPSPSFESRRSVATVQARGLTTAQEYATQARSLAAARNFAGAAQRIGLAIQVDATDPTLYYDHGVYLEQSGETKAAEDAYRESARLDPRSVPAWVRLGILRQRSGRLEEARDAFQRAVAVDPGHAVANSAIGEMYADTKAYVYARPRFETALQTDSTYAPAHYGLANLLYDSNDRRAALHHYQQFLKFRRADESVDAVNFVKARISGLGG